MLVEAIYGAYAALACSVAYLYAALLIKTLEGGREALCTPMGRIVAGVTILSVSSALLSTARIAFFHESLSHIPIELMVFLSAMMTGWFMLAAHWFMDGGKLNKHRAIIMALWMGFGASVSVLL